MQHFIDSMEARLSELDAQIGSLQLEKGTVPSRHAASRQDRIRKLLDEWLPLPDHHFIDPPPATPSASSNTSATSLPARARLDEAWTTRPATASRATRALAAKLHPTPYRGLRSPTRSFHSDDKTPRSRRVD